VSAPEITAALLLRVEEGLRQERETFDQRKEQEARWFTLRLRMGYTAAVLLPAIAVGCGVVLYLHDNFPLTVVGSAGAALFVDVLSLFVAVWKLVLNPRSITQLKPITSSDASEIDRLPETPQTSTDNP
jgi:dolichyl-phosphate-mannose--protein O-mannosyl transferase